MRLLTKLIVLSAILVADLIFFMVLPTYFPETFDMVFQRMPWEDDIEKTFAILSGLVIAVLSSSAVVYILLQRVRESLKRG